MALDARIPEEAIAWVNRRDFNDEAMSATRTALSDHSRLSQLRFFMYSYKLGSGISYDRPSKAAFGIFDNPQLAPEQCSQMIHRFRQAKRYAWYQAGGEPEAPHETMPSMIQARNERNLARTGRKPKRRLLDFNALISRDVAYRDASRNNLVVRMHALEYYQGHNRFILDWTKRSDQQKATIAAHGNRSSNLTVACPPCNNGKHDKPKSVWLKRLAMRGIRHEDLPDTVPVQRKML